MEETTVENIPLPEESLDYVSSELSKVNSPSTPPALQGTTSAKFHNRSLYQMSNLSNEIHSIKEIRQTPIFVSQPPLPPLPPPPKPPPPPIPEVENVFKYQGHIVGGKYFLISYIVVQFWSY